MRSFNDIRYTLHLFEEKKDFFFIQKSTFEIYRYLKRTCPQLFYRTLNVS
jgi:hypothetical protein